MRPNEMSRARLISVDVRCDEAGMLIGTSPQLPGLLAIATCDEELADELPALISTFCEARFGERVSVHELGQDDVTADEHRRSQWAAVPVAD